MLSNLVDKDHYPRIKMEEGDAAGTATVGPPEDPGNGIHVVQVGIVGELPHPVTPSQIKVEPEERQLQCWEAQLQDFLKKVESSHTVWDPTQPSRVKPSLVLSDVYRGRGGKGVARLQAALGEGGQVISRTLKPSQESCQKVKKILSDGTLEMEFQRQSFRSFCYQDTEGPRKACSQLQELCYGWLMPEKHTKEQIVELVILEQFLNVLPSEVQTWVRAFGPETCSQAVALAEGFLLRQRKAKREEKQVMERFEKLPESFSKAEPTSSDRGGKHPRREMKPERNGDTGSLGRTMPANEPSKESKGMASIKSEHKEEEGIFSNQTGPERQVEISMEQSKTQSIAGPGGDAYRVSAPQKIPEGARRFICPVCGKGFTRQSSVTRHQRIHTGEKPYQCSDCGKNFRYMSVLIVHQRIHAREKAYICSACGESYDQAHACRHQTSHATETQSACVSQSFVL
ncbi:zinc finger and SCAN domain-containing protein 16-like isoform X2 [Hemicordylus capensis]|uniref:zinc finger and SCAN domain-containing protein 16-like isoform X2 n=1 Tax=Hemicordylus capensis TaxID=884348 RepID=UPI0023026B83|nr:zinc finger and SCAN domain-containing protein 16-like isoform X2 [Hemicordylus capensis]